MWDSAEHDMRGWHRQSACMGGHQLDGLRSVESGRGSLPGRVRGRGEERRGSCQSQLLLCCQLVGGRSMFQREGEERKEAVASGNV